MPLLAFVDVELEEKIDKILNKKNTEEEKTEYPEYEFLASCIRVGINYEYLEKFTYIEIMKILYSFIDTKDSNNNKNKSFVRMATQTDIDKFLS